MKRPAFLLAVLLPAAALSSTLIPHTLAQRFAASDRVALVQVLSRVTEAQGNERNLKTFTRLLIGEDYKGSGPREVTLVQIGGRLGNVESRIPGDADFTVGETALVFLHCRTPERCYLTALGEGKVAISGGDAIVHDLFTGEWSRKPLERLISEMKKAQSSETKR
ncbi:MAG: hypothetical protein AB1938_11960 [Myxococcota bacterium]